jgi:hypothetical protein
MVNATVKVSYVRRHDVVHIAPIAENEFLSMQPIAISVIGGE